MARRKLVSVCMIARDEEALVGRAIRSTASLADEVVLIDTGSTDRTVEIAQTLGAHVYHDAWQDDFARARNAALEHARYEWIVMLDADEWFDREGARRLRTVLQRVPDDVSGFTLRIVNTLVGRPEAVIDRTNIFRVFRNRPAHRYTGAIHEQIVHTLEDGRVGRSDITLWHDGYDPGRAAERGKVERNLRILRAERARLAETDPRTWYVEMQMGTEQLRRRDPGQAVGHFLAAVRLVWDMPYAVMNAPSISVLVGQSTRTLVQLGRAQEAFALADHFVQSGWNLPSVWFGRGYAAIETGDAVTGVRDLLWSVSLAEAMEDSLDYTSETQLQISWGLAVRALLAHGAPEAAAALAVHGLRGRPEDGDLLALASEISRRVPGLVAFLQARLPRAAAWPFARQAAAEGRADVVAAMAARLAADGDPHAAVAEALVALARGDRQEAVRRLSSVRADSPAYAAAKFALDRLRPGAGDEDRAGHGEEVVAI